MPNIRDAITITSTVAASASATQWAVPAIVGVSGATAKNTPKSFKSLTSVKTEHGDSSAISAGAKAMFDAGVKEIYTVSVDMASTSPTAAEIETALATLVNYVSSGSIQGVALAGITDLDSLAKLKAFADANRVIFVATHAENETVSNIVTAAASLKSENGCFVAYKGLPSSNPDDVACAVLGAIMLREPYFTLAWMPVQVNVDEYFNPTDLATLEAGRVNAIIYQKSQNQLSNGLSLDSDVPFLDTTRMKYYIESLIRDSIADSRISAKNIPYTQKGFEAIKGWIGTPLEQLRRNNFIESYSVTIPKVEDISTANQASRKITGIVVTVQTISDVQEFSMNLNIEV